MPNPGLSWRLWCQVTHHDVWELCVWVSHMVLPRLLEVAWTPVWMTESSGGFMCALAFGSRSCLCQRI